MNPIIKCVDCNSTDCKEYNDINKILCKKCKKLDHNVYYKKGKIKNMFKLTEKDFIELDRMPEQINILGFYSRDTYTLYNVDCVKQYLQNVE
jgi:hypothetical protein